MLRLVGEGLVSPACLVNTGHDGTAEPSEAVSSPRLRGTRCVQCSTARGSRFIPAPAGNTACWRSWRRPAAVHPRACGEHSRSTGKSATRCGSSPRLRGILDQKEERGREARFIPAPAGNTCEVRCFGCHVSVHPRACGEHPAALNAEASCSGSSPRLRGTLPPSAIR